MWQTATVQGYKEKNQASTCYSYSPGRGVHILGGWYILLEIFYRIHGWVFEKKCWLFQTVLNTHLLKPATPNVSWKVKKPGDVDNHIQLLSRTPQAHADSAMGSTAKKALNVTCLVCRALVDTVIGALGHLLLASSLNSTNRVCFEDHLSLKTYTSVYWGLHNPGKMRLEPVGKKEILRSIVYRVRSMISLL